MTPQPLASAHVVPLPEAAAGQVAVPAPSRERWVRVLYTGFGEGLAGASDSTVSEVAPLFDSRRKRDFRVSGWLTGTVYRRGDWFISRSDDNLRVSELREFLLGRRGGLDVLPAGERRALLTEGACIIDTGDRKGDPGCWLLPWLWDVERASGEYPDAQMMRARRYTLLAADGQELDLWQVGNGVAPSAATLGHPDEWERRHVGSVVGERPDRSSSLLVIPRPYGDTLRRSQFAKAWRAQLGEQTLLVDLGNLFNPGESDLARDLRALALQHVGTLKLDALVPAEPELALNEADWATLASRVPLLAANVKRRDEAASGLSPWLMKEVSNLKVLLVGLVDDRTVGLYRRNAAGARWVVEEPISALERLEPEIRAQGADCVVIVTNIGDERLEVVRRSGLGHAVLADMWGGRGHSIQEVLKLDGQGVRRTSSNLTFLAHSSRNRVGLLEAQFVQAKDEHLELRELSNTARLVTDQVEGDRLTRVAVDVLKDRHQARRTELLVPDLREVAALVPDCPKPENPGALMALDGTLFNRLITDVLLERSGAELAINRFIGVKAMPTGPVTEYAIERFLDTGDRVMVGTLNGKSLKALLELESAKQLVIRGLKRGQPLKVMGHPVQDDEFYRVVTTDALMAQPRVAPIFATGRWQALGIGPEAQLQQVVLGTLVERKRMYGGFTADFMNWFAGAIKEGDALTRPRWLMRLDDGDLQVNTYRNRGNEAFAQVRNTRVNTPDTLSLGGKGRLAIAFENSDLTWENRLRAINRRQTINKEGAPINQETDDEILLTTEFRMKRWQWPWGSGAGAWPVTPYLSGNYTTEFNPDVTGAIAKARRAELNAVTGMILSPGMGFKDLRAGVVVKHDLANPGLPEPGLVLAANYEQTLAPYFPATFKSGLDLINYLPVATDTADRLGLMATLNAGLVIPLWERLNLNVMADWFLFTGKVTQTTGLGNSLDLRVGLGYTLTFKPLAGIWY